MAALFSAPKFPDPKKAPPMPDSEGPGALAARRRMIAEQMAMGGRSSTTLTTPTMATGMPYSAAKLGAA